MSAEIHHLPDLKGCRFCGDHHKGEACPLIEAIEYWEDGTISRIEFRDMTEAE